MKAIPSYEQFGTVDQFINNRERLQGITRGNPDGARQAFVKFQNSPLLVARRDPCNVKVRVFSQDDLLAVIKMHDPFQQL